MNRGEYLSQKLPPWKPNQLDVPKTVGSLTTGIKKKSFGSQRIKTSTPADSTSFDQSTNSCASHQTNKELAQLARSWGKSPQNQPRWSAPTHFSPSWIRKANSGRRCRRPTFKPLLVYGGAQVSQIGPSRIANFIPFRRYLEERYLTWKEIQNP